MKKDLVHHVSDNMMEDGLWINKLSLSPFKQRRHFLNCSVEPIVDTNPCHSQFPHNPTCKFFILLFLLGFLYGQQSVWLYHIWSNFTCKSPLLFPGFSLTENDAFSFHHQLEYMKWGSTFKDLNSHQSLKRWLFLHLHGIELMYLPVNCSLLNNSFKMLLSATTIQLTLPILRVKMSEYHKSHWLSVIGYSAHIGWDLRLTITKIIFTWHRTRNHTSSPDLWRFDMVS